METTETESYLDLDNLLLMYAESWDSETKIFLNHLETKKRETEKISSLQKEVDVRRFDMENLDEQTQPDYNKLEEIYHRLKAKEALYDNHLKCTLLYEQPNVYKISFLDNDSSVKGWIRLEYEQTKNKWTILEMQPSNVVPNAIVDQFRELRDTQSFLCQFRRILFNA